MKKSKVIKRILKHLQKYKDLYALIVAVLAAITTFICSLVSISALQSQVDIAKEQMIMQKNVNQPFFKIYSVVSCDKEDDDIKGTERLYIENIGQRYLTCKVEEMVFFSLEKSLGKTESRVIVAIPYYFQDYYPPSSDQSSIVYYGEGIGSNRLFGDLYKATLNTDYWITKIILVKISYTDVYNEKHVKYYNKNEEIEKNEYDSIIALSVYGYRIEDITFQKMKELLRQQEDSKEK